METIDQLARVIGPRPAGTEGEARAASYLVDRVAALGLDPEIERFAFRIWESDGVGRLVVRSGGRELELAGACLPYTFPAAPGGVTGRIVRVGAWPLIPRRLTCELFQMIASDGDPIAAVLVFPAGATRPLPNPVALLSLPSVVLGREDGDRLREFCAADGGVDARLETPQHRERLAGSANIVFGTRGSGPTVIVAAHYDCVEGSQGANDNATGVSVLLRIARRFKELTRGTPGLRFVLLGAEEPFLVGSRHHVMAAAARGELDGVVSSLNLDMLGVGERLAIRRSTDGTWDVISATLAGTLVGATSIGETPLPPSSDHWSFHEAGIPSAQLTREPDSAWHTPEDTIDRVDPARLDESEEAAARLVEAALDHSASGRVQSGPVLGESQTTLQETL